MSGVGKKLRKARQAKGLSLEEVRRATKIHPGVLEALENGKLEDSLGRAYVRAFLKTYAEYLGLEAKKIVLEYSSGFSPESEKTAIVLHPKPLFRERNNAFKYTIIIVFVVAAWSAILAFAVSRFTDSRRSFMAAREDVAKTPSAAERAQKEQGPAVATETRKIQDAGDAFIPIPKRRDITLAVTAHKDVWLKVSSDGKVVFHGILPKKSKETWRASGEIKLGEIGRPEALSVNVNNKDIDFSRTRVGKDILITPEGVNLEPE